MTASASRLVKHRGPPPPGLKDKTLPPDKRSFSATEQQLLFVKEWAAGNSVYAASVRAGYMDGGSYAYQMIKNPHVVALYEKEKAKYEAAADMSREKVMNMLQEAYDMAKLMSEPSSMVAAAREVGKMCGYYAPVERKIKIEGNVILDKMNRLSDAELLELVQGSNQQIGAAVAHAIEEIEHEETTGEEAHHDDAQALARSAQRLERLPAPEDGGEDPRDDAED